MGYPIHGISHDGNPIDVPWDIPSWDIPWDPMGYPLETLMWTTTDCAIEQDTRDHAKSFTYIKGYLSLSLSIYIYIYLFFVQN